MAEACGRMAAAALWVAQLATGAKSFVDNPFLPLAGFDVWSLTGLARWRTRIERWLSTGWSSSACAATSSARSARSRPTPPRIV